MGQGGLSSGLVAGTAGIGWSGAPPIPVSALCWKILDWQVSAGPGPPGPGRLSFFIGMMGCLLELR